MPAPAAAAAVARPDWLKRDAPAEAAAPVVVTPSEDETPVWRDRSGGSVEARRNAMRRGVLIHRLMQSLPEIAPDRRADAARRHVARAAGDLAPAEQEGLVATVLQLFAEPRFAPLFSPGSRAEVPIVGRLDRPSRTPLAVSGQIDRLAVTPEAVLIADYKTNRPAPRSPAEVPDAYVRQLALYRAVVARLYPERPVRAVLVWTDVPDLMEISPDLLDRTLARVTSA
jgi:ATP-dependent helicase/nuclease subunit A